MGLSYPGASVSGERPLFDLLMDQHALPEKVFSLYLTQKPDQPGSTLLLGGIDRKFHMDEITFYPVEKPYVFWMLNISSVYLRETALSAASAAHRRVLITLCDEQTRRLGCRAVIDSGTSVISGPSGNASLLACLLARLLAWVVELIGFIRCHQQAGRSFVR